ncbi:hypothetical protein BGX20_006881, partial [Mortierella sp. AD010]
MQQGQKVRVEWVKGHAASQGNIAADRAAQLGHNTGLWQLNSNEHSDLICHARFGNTVIEDDLRRFIKRQSAVRINTQWVNQNRTKENVRNWKAVDWKATLNIVHNGNTPRGLFTSMSDCRKRAHRIKKLHGMLPTLVYMKHWRPDLYNTDICRVCEMDREDTQHLWRCAMTLEKQLQGWEKAVKDINSDGKRAWAKERSKWLEARRIAMERGMPVPSQGEPKFSEVKEDIIWRVLSARIDNLAEIQRARDITDEENATEERTNTQERPKWTVQDLYQGLTPKSFTAEWKSIFKTSTSVARYMVGRF